jgi:hypothetical protein
MDPVVYQLQISACKAWRPISKKKKTKSIAARHGRPFGVDMPATPAPNNAAK